jgi:hypothetical protein
MRDPISQSLDARRVFVLQFGLKTPRDARVQAVQSNPIQNRAQCYFYIAVHLRSTLNGSCVAQVRPRLIQSTPQTPQTPRLRTSFPCVLYQYSEFPPQTRGGLAPLAHKSRTHHRLRLVILGHGALRASFPLLHCLLTPS